MGKSAGFSEKGTPWNEIERKLKEFKQNDLDWKGGRLPSYTYYYDEELLNVQMDAYRMYAVENGLGEGRAFGSLSMMHADITRMAMSIFNGAEDGAASFTSGGTESLFEAVRTAKKRHIRDKGRGSHPLNIVAPYSAHAALSKAGEYLEVEIVRVPLADEYRADPAAMEAKVNEGTIMLFGSAPCYPYGVIDPIPALGQIALKHDLWLHVDGCWGGFITPFAKQLGYPIPDWDLSVPGVTSLSADIHKFGYGAKGASLLMFNDPELRELERFTFSGWPRGTYSTPTFAGSKAAGSVAAAWAVMNFLGNEGYVRTTKASMDATMGLIKGIDAIDGLECLKPVGESNLFAFVSTDPDVDIMAVADVLAEKGWMPGRMREPLSIQQGVNPVHLAIVDEYVEEVSKAVKAVRAAKKSGEYDEHTY